MILKKLIIIFLLTFTLNLGISNSRVLSNSSRHITENILQQNYTRDNDEFIKEVEKKRFSEMVRLYIRILDANRHSSKLREYG